MEINKTIDLTMAEARNLWGFKLLPNGNYEIISCKSSRPTLFIPSSIDGIKVERVKGEIFQKNKIIEEVHICEGIIELGENLFDSCKNLKNVYLPSTLKCIKNYAFYNCAYLVNVFIPENSSLEIIENNAFSGCKSLENLSIPSTIKSLGTNSIFYTGYYFEKNNLPVITFDNATYFGNKDNPYLILVNAINEDISSCNIHENTKFIFNNAFRNCKNLKEIILPNGLIEIGEQSFYGTSISKLTLPNSVKVIKKGAFRYCANLSDVIFGDNLKVIDDCAFENCNNLVKINLPNGLLKIGDQAFYKYENKLDVTIPSSIEYIGDYAFNVEKDFHLFFLESDIPLFIHNRLDETKQEELLNFTELNGVLYLGNKDNPYLVLSKIKDKNIETCTIHNDTKIILNSAFSRCNNLKSITIPSGVTQIGKDAFYECRNLQEVNLPESLNYLEESAFKDCINLEKISMPSTMKTLGSHAFFGCKKLNSISVPSGIESIEPYTFCCSGLSNVTLPSTLISIEDSAFSRCINLKHIDLPESLVSISRDALAGCDLESLFIPKNVKKICYSSYYGQEPYEFAYRYNKNLKEIKVAENNQKFYFDGNKIKKRK
ncbi:MAG: leucine-rich repeat domain-containing protein [Clostridia bacterium]|nr:leucine-rich repeat domain-containing protein [Clostridia bacterium]